MERKIIILLVKIKDYMKYITIEDYKKLKELVDQIGDRI